MPYIDVDLRPAAAVVAFTLLLIVVIRAVERYAHTAATRRTRRALEQALQHEAVVDSGPAPARLGDAPIDSDPAPAHRGGAPEDSDPAPALHGGAPRSHSLPDP